MNSAQAGPISAARSRHHAGVCMRKWTFSGGKCATTGGLHAPAQEMAIALVDVAEGAARQRVAFDVMDAALLDLAFVLGRPRPTGRDEEAVVLGALAIAALHLGIVQRSVHDGGAEIIEHDPARHAAEELEG